MASDGGGNRPLTSLILLGIVDFVCILTAAESYNNGQFTRGTVWLVVGIVSSVIGFKWPEIKIRLFPKQSMVAPQPPAVKDSDPCVDVEIVEKRDRALTEVLFVLTNNGGGVARNVQIEPLKLRSGKVTFECVGALSKGGKKAVTLYLEDTGAVLAFDVIRLFNQEWDVVGTEQGTIPEELIVPVRIAYQDYVGAWFQTCAAVVFYGIKEHLKRHPSFRHFEPVISIRDVRSGPREIGLYEKH